MNKVLLSALLAQLFGLTWPAVTGATPDAGFSTVSSVLQSKCADCHAPSRVKYPIYYKLPIARQVISRDIKAGQNRFSLTEDQLTGNEPLSLLQLAMLESVIKDGSMPPTKYKAMHRNSSVSPSEKQGILDWIAQECQSREARPTPTDNRVNH